MAVSYKIFFLFFFCRERVVSNFSMLLLVSVNVVTYKIKVYTTWEIENCNFQ